MKLVKCYVSAFGKLKDFSFDFNEGLNTIKQDNGWGKSTLATFIKVMFYGIDSNKRSISENDRIKYRPWNSTEKFGGAIWFIWGDKEYKIERFFGNKDSEDTVNLYDVATGKSFSNTENLGKRIFEIDEEGFLSTTYFSQKEFEIKSNTSITAKFNSICEAQDSDAFDSALLKLENKAKKYKYRGDKGVISEIKKEIYFVDEQISKTNNSLVTSKHLKNEIIEMEKEVNALQVQTKSLTEKVAVASKMEALADKKNRYEKLSSKRQSLNENKIFAEQIFNGKTVCQKDINEVRSNLFELKNAEERISQLNSDIEKLENLNNAPKTNKGRKLNAIFYSVAILGFIAGIIQLFALGFKSIIAWVDLSVFFALIISKLIFDFTTFKKGKIDNTQQFFLTERKKEILDLEKYTREIENNISDFILGFNFGEELGKDKAVEYLDKIFNAYQNVLAELKAIDEELLELKKYEKDFNLISDKVDDLETLNSLLNNVQNEYTKKSFELGSLRSKLKVHEEIASSYNELESKKVELLERLKQAEEDYKILNLTLKFLTKADENLKTKYREPLQESLKKYFSYISDVEKKLKIDIDLDVTVEESGAEKSIEYYSKGYQNLFEICKRFALTDVLFTGEKPFIILDDPFYNLDNKKLQSALKLIEKLSLEYQIVYLVCHESRVA